MNPAHVALRQVPGASRSGAALKPTVTVEVRPTGSPLGVTIPDAGLELPHPVQAHCFEVEHHRPRAARTGRKIARGPAFPRRVTEHPAGCSHWLNGPAPPEAGWLDAPAGPKSAASA